MPRKRATSAPKPPAIYQLLPSSVPLLDLYELMPARGSRLLNAMGDYAGALGRDIWQSLRWLRRHLSLRRLIWWLVVLASALGVSIMLLGGLLTATTLTLYGKDIANPATLIHNKKSGATITDRNGVVLYQSLDSRESTTVAYKDIPQTVVDATLAAEDPDFFKHTGVSWRGISRALYKNVQQGGTVEGGSTLTQQLVKNTVLRQDRNVLRKAEELILTVEMERRYNKQQIMELYLNGIYYGQDSYGIAQAAEHYFGKPLGKLTIGETALLAGLPLGPSRFDPNYSLNAATGRRDYILDRMAHLGSITPQQAAAAKAETLATVPISHSIRAPHFVFYVLDKLRSTYGDDLVDHGGITVTTTLDITKQEVAEQQVRQQIGALSGRGVTNGALLSTNPTSGDILAMVGSEDYYQPDFGSVNVTTALRQPGSSFKPLVYLAAFMKGWNDGTTVDDAPMQIPDGPGRIYEPRNYDGKFRGQVTLRRALANSLNIPAIKVLQFVTLPTAIDMARALGITTLGDATQYGPSLVLGGGDVTMIDMAAAYGTFARGGVQSHPRSILTVRDRYGKDITVRPSLPENRVAPESAVAMLTSVLSDNGARSEEFGPNSPLLVSRPAAVKTGTTNDFRDNWTAGYTPNLVTVVWVGNNDNAPMQNVDGITGAAPIWHNFMEAMFAAGTY